ncbi:MAG: MarR family winged helix-turn-helix transcriptional regulator [Chloroflexaceae bacterium]|jgi:DNA-binding MarR family transcriptional regulator|nr:MarR family winged helix-turn-helix transcriptional regulator [Chloroflexaceae bacterium]
MSDIPCGDNLSSTLRRLNLAIRRAFDVALDAHNLTQAQSEVMRHVCQQNGMEQRVLQERLGITSPTLTGIVDGLVERRLLARQVSPEDGRVKQLYVTDAGWALDATMAAVARHIESSLLQGFSPAELALLNDWLERMLANVGDGRELPDRCD